MEDLKAKLKFPLFVIDGLDVSLYNSIEALEQQLEGIDVANNIYKSYDAEGRLLKLRAIGAKQGKFMVSVGYVHIEEAEDIPGHNKELSEALRAHINAVGHSVDDNTELKELVRICARRQMEGN
jgi:hypothetical protein